MLNLYENINPAYCIIISFALIVLAIINFILYKKRKDNLYLILSLIALGLFYDTFITGIGYRIQNFKYFYQIGMLRHVLHGLLTPLIIVFVYRIFKDCGLLKNHRYKNIVITIVVFITVSALVAILTSPVNLIDYGGVIRHSIDKDNAFILSSLILKSLSFGTLFPMIIGSVISLKYQKDYNVLIATIFMTIFTFVGIFTDPKLIFQTSFLGELLLVVFFKKYVNNNYNKVSNTKMEELWKK